MSLNENATAHCSFEYEFSLIVRLHEQKFCCIASGNIRVHGVVDGIDLSDNVMKTNRINTVTGAKTFTGGLMIVSDDIVVEEGNLVDGVDLSEWKRLAAVVTGDYTVSASIAMPAVALQQNLM